MDHSNFGKVLEAGTDQQKSWEFSTYVERHLPRDRFPEFQEDIMKLPPKIRGLYLITCFTTGVRGDGFDGAFSFYGYEGRLLIDEIKKGFDLIGLKTIPDIIEKAFEYWKDPKSPMHTDDVPWMRLDDDLGGVLDPFYKATKGLDDQIGAFITDIGAEALHEM